MSKAVLSSLGYYIKETLFENWAKARTDIETDMQTNLDAFNAVVTGDYWKTEEAQGWRSDTFVQITKMKVIAAYSMVIDILLQGGQIPFTLKPSPWDLVVFEKLPEPQQKIIEAAIDDMQGLIRQQLGDCYADRHLMKMVMAAAIYGWTWGKYFVHEVMRTGFRNISMAPEGLQDTTGQFTRWEGFVEYVNSPAFEYVSDWSIYHDLESEDIQAGVGIIQRDMISAYDLRQFAGRPFWINSAIDRAIKEADQPGTGQAQGSSKHISTLPPGLRNIDKRHKTIQRLEFWGRIPAKIVEEWEKELPKMDSTYEVAEPFDYTEFEHDGNEIEIMAVMADDEIVRYALNKPNSRPYYKTVWEIALDETTGTGVAKNMRPIQKVLNGAVRAFEDNKKLSANVIAAIKRQFLPNWDGIFKPGTEIEVSDDCEDARKAIQQIIIADVGETLLSLIALFERYGDEVSQLPKILQGAVAEKRKPDTLGELNMLQANAGKYLGSVIKNFDEGIIEPIVTDFYHYNMKDPKVRFGKGNYIAQALGYASFQNHVVRLHKLMQGMALVMSSELLIAETKVGDVLEEIWKALEIDPDQVMKSDDEKTKEAQEKAFMQAQAEEKVRQLRREERMEEEASKEADHRRKLAEIEAKGEKDIEKQDKKFEDDLILKSIDNKNKEPEKKEKKAA